MLKEEVVVISGGSQGIGRATVHRLARDGVDDAIGVTSREWLESVSKEAESFGAQVLSDYCDCR